MERKTLPRLLSLCAGLQALVVVSSTYDPRPKAHIAGMPEVGGGGACPIRFWQISLPYLNQRGQIYPPNYIYDPRPKAHIGCWNELNAHASMPDMT